MRPFEVDVSSRYIQWAVHATSTGYVCCRPRDHSLDEAKQLKRKKYILGEAGSRKRPERSYQPRRYVAAV